MNNLEERAAAVQKIIDNYSKPSEPTIKSIKDYFPDNIPEGDFKWDAVEAGDWHAVAVEDEDDWYKVAYATNIGRMYGKLYLEYFRCDDDGDWSVIYYWEEGETKKYEKDILIELGSEMDDYFASWAEYDLYCYRTGKDPLDQAMRPLTKEEWIKSAEDNAKFLNDRLNK